MILSSFSFSLFGMYIYWVEEKFTTIIPIIVVVLPTFFLRERDQSLFYVRVFQYKKRTFIQRQ